MVSPKSLCQRGFKMVFTKCDCGFALGVLFHSPQNKLTIILENQSTKVFLSVNNKNWLVEFSSGMFLNGIQ